MALFTYPFLRCNPRPLSGPATLSPRIHLPPSLRPPPPDTPFVLPPYRSVSLKQPPWLTRTIQPLRLSHSLFFYFYLSLSLAFLSLRVPPFPYLSDIPFLAVSRVDVRFIRLKSKRRDELLHAVGFCLPRAILNRETHWTIVRRTCWATTRRVWPFAVIGGGGLRRVSVQKDTTIVHYHDDYQIERCLLVSAQIMLVKRHV